MPFYGNTIRSKINLLQSGDTAATWYKAELFKNSEFTSCNYEVQGRKRFTSQNLIITVTLTCRERPLILRPI